MNTEMKQMIAHLKNQKAEKQACITIEVISARQPQHIETETKTKHIKKENGIATTRNLALKKHETLKREISTA